MATRTLPSPHILDSETPPAAGVRKPALLRRLFDAMIEAQMQRAQREIDRALGPDGVARLRQEMARRPR